MRHGLFLGVIIIEEQRGIRGQFQLPLPYGSHKHFCKLGEWTPHKFLEPVLPRTRQKHKKSHHNRTRTDTITPSTSYVVLHVHKNRRCRQRPCAHEEVEPVKELYHLLLLAFVRIIELIRPEPRHTRFQTTSAKSRYVKRQIQHQ